MRFSTKTISLILFLCMLSSIAQAWGFGFSWPRPSLRRATPTRSVEALRQRVTNLETSTTTNKAGISKNADALANTKNLAGRLGIIDSNVGALSDLTLNLSDEVSGYKQRIADLENRPIGGSNMPEPIQVFADGEVIGVAKEIYPEAMVIKFNTHFESENLRPDGTIYQFGSTLRFKNENCEGEVFISGISGGADNYFNTAPLKGKIIICQSETCEYPLYYYPPKDKNIYYTTVRSRYSGGFCQSFHARTGYYFKVLPNDQAVTGVKEYPFPTPITYTGVEPLNIINSP